MPLEPGTRLGNYEVVGPLGAGGMGQVYRARDTRLDRAVAIKALPESLARDPDRAARLEREAKALAALSHTNIAVIYGIEDVGGASYLALELIDGDTLADRIARGPLDVAETIAIGAQLAAAIDAAHERSIVHRDLKPSNVMLTRTGVVKVLDFGLAKGGNAVGDASSLAGPPSGATMTFAAATADGVILGTAPYMSPEQARGKPVDRRTDVWALGCILYECLSARQAFPGETQSDVLARIIERDPDWNLLPASTPSRLRDLMRRCLTKDASQRPRDAGDLRGELLAIAQDASSPGVAADSGATPSVAVLYFENLSGASESDYFCAGITEDILTDLAKLKGLRVASRNAVARFRGANPDIAQVARELGVGHVLEGSVRRAGDRVRISAQLVSANGFHLWAERYDRTLEDVFAVQEEIAKAITGALSVALTPAEEKKLGQDRPADVRAYDLYLKGRAEYSRYTAEGMQAAIRWFEQAIALEPRYALAHAGIADACGQMSQWQWTDDADALLRRSLESARRAVALDPSLAEVHKAEALVLGQMGDEEGSFAALKRALQANPRYTPALGNLAVHHYIAGDLAAAERALRRSLAVERDSVFTHAWLSYILTQEGRYTEAEKVLSDIDASSRDGSAATFAFGGRAWAAFMQNDLEGIRRAVAQGSQFGADPGNLTAFRALLAVKSGDREEAAQLLEEALDPARTKTLNLGGIASAAVTAFELGKPERAVELLHRRLSRRLAPVMVRLEPALHPLLDLPAFAPRRSPLTLVWPVEAPMIDPARLALFKEVKIASGTPGGSSVLDE